MDIKRYIVGVTGASGVIYGIRLIEKLLELGHFVYVIVTDSGWEVLKHELKWDSKDNQQFINEYFNNTNKLSYYHINDLSAPIASGSYHIDGMVIIPCSMGTLSKIAHGNSSNLLERAADVMLKEDRQLIVVPRETPLNSIHLKNMLELSIAGSKIIPAMPGFYYEPNSIDDLVNHIVGKVLDSLGIEHTLFKRWGD